MTAWNASEWGVIFSIFTVGIITQASATWAVKPPSRPTMPTILAPISLAYIRAWTKLGLIFFSENPIFFNNSGIIKSLTIFIFSFIE